MKLNGTDIKRIIVTGNSNNRNSLTPAYRGRTSLHSKSRLEIMKHHQNTTSEVNNF